MRWRDLFKRKNQTKQKNQESVRWNRISYTDNGSNLQANTTLIGILEQIGYKKDSLFPEEISDLVNKEKIYEFWTDPITGEKIVRAKGNTEYFYRKSGDKYYLYERKVVIVQD